MRFFLLIATYRKVVKEPWRQAACELYCLAARMSSYSQRGAR